ncbi:MAG: hypothetical protein HY584_02060, partial [Candidatus Omnitrophica bacterium]|nr:hypothetical protein [Candidatus Omnitrophota bacterium]
MKTNVILHPTLLLFFALLLTVSSPALATLDEIKDRGPDLASDRALDRLNRGGSFGAGGGGYVPDDWEREASGGFLGEGDDEQSYKDSAERERERINKRYKKHEDAEIEHRDKLTGIENEKYREDREREKRLDKLNKEKLDKDRDNAQHDIDRFNQTHGPQGGWTPEERAEYDKLVDKHAQLVQPTEEEAKDIQKHQEQRDKIYQQIRNGAFQMGNLSPEQVQERLDRAETADAATRTWRDFTFTGKMVTEVQDDIVRQRERGIFANNMIMSADLYLQNPNLTTEEREIAEGIRYQNLTARGAAADAISKDMAVVTLGVASDVGMLGVGRIVSKAVGAVGNAIRGGGGGGGGAPGTGGSGGAGGSGAAGTEAGQAAGGGAGAKPVSSATQDAIDAGKAAVGKYGSLDQAADDLIGAADDVVMPVEAAAANAEVAAIKASANKLSPAEVEKLFEKGANLTPTQIIQKAEILAQREALKQAILQ